jgi:hypothetical protein
LLREPALSEPLSDKAVNAAMPQIWLLPPFANVIGERCSISLFYRAFIDFFFSVTHKVPSKKWWQQSTNH